MSDPKGPKIDLPDELVDELDTAAEEAEGTQPVIEIPIDGDPPAAADPSGSADAPASPAGGDVSGPELLDQARDRYLRLAADFENYKRRTLREREELFHYANENLIKELLGTVDNLERALEHAQNSTQGGDSKTLLEGVELTHRSLMQALDKFGVQVVDPEGGQFDPALHEAIRQVPSEEHPPGAIVEILQKGYLLRERLLRPALVVVSSGS